MGAKRQKLTNAILKKARLAPDSKRKIDRLWDSAVPGLGIRLTRDRLVDGETVGGSKTWVLSYRDDHGNVKRPKLGRWPDLSIAQARKLARQKMAEIQLGHDPFEKQKSDRESMTLNEFFDNVWLPMKQHEKKKSSLKIDEYNYNRHIRKQIGKVPIQAITKKQIKARVLSPILGNGTRTAHDRVLALLKTIFNTAIDEEMVDPPGPCFRVKAVINRKTGGGLRNRYVTLDEYKRLLAALDECDENPNLRPAVLDAIRFLLFLGCRKSEALNLKWDFIDFDNQVMNLPDSKVGAVTYHLNKAAMGIIDRQKRLSPFVFCAKNGKRIKTIRHTWQIVCDVAEIQDMHIHDMRHGIATLAVSAGAGMPMIQHLLNHKEQATTQRYAHGADQALRRLSDTIGDEILSLAQAAPVETVERHEAS